MTLRNIKIFVSHRDIFYSLILIFVNNCLKIRLESVLDIEISASQYCKYLGSKDALASLKTDFGLGLS